MQTRFSVPFCLVLSGILLVAGCDSKKNQPVPKKPGDEAAAHVHGPNHGELYELGGDDYHAELLQDVDHKVVTIYVLDKNQNPLPIAEEAVTIRMTLADKPAEFLLSAKPLEGEAAGSASRFESKDEALTLALADQTAAREIEVKIDGKPHVAKFEYYEPHHHAHDHDEHGDHDDHEAHDHKGDEKAGHDDHEHKGHDEDGHKEGEHHEATETGATN